MMSDWEDFKTALTLLRSKTLAGAAEALGVSYTTVSRRITRLEVALGTTLFERLSDGYRPTEAALIMAASLNEMEDAENRMMRRLAGQDQRLSGPLVVTAPQLIIAHVMGPALQVFRTAHPDVELSLRATNDLLDLTRREADLGVRISKSPGDTLKGLRLAQQHNAFYGTEDWAARFHEDPDGPLDWIVYSGQPVLSDKVMAAAAGSRVRYRMDDMVAIAGAAQAGLGIARLPMFLGRKTSGLVRVPILPPQPYADIWVVAHPDVWPSAKVTAFRTVLQSDLKSRRALFVADA